MELQKFKKSVIKMRVLAIIPCFNEWQSIENTVENLKAKAQDVDFVVVNDGSWDDTYEVCTQNGYPVVNLPFNLGLANAVQTGMRYAYNNDYDMALQFDGDGQHLPEYISEMIGLMSETSADIIIGSRYLQKRSGSMRSVGMLLLRLAVLVATGRKLSDPTSGMRLFNRKMIERFAVQMNYGPEPDTLVYLINQGAKVLELPVAMQERKAGKSYLGALNAANYMLRMFVSIIIVQWFRVKEKEGEI